MKSSIFSVEMGRLFGNSSHNSASFETVISVVKVVLITVGIVSSVILLKISVIPCISSFLVSTLPCLWSFLRSLLSPPYIYILLNFIILTIAASSSKPQKTKTTYPIVQAPDDDQEESRELDFPEEVGAEEPLIKEASFHLCSDLSGKTDPTISRESSADVKEMIFDPPEPSSPGKPEDPGGAEEPGGTYDSVWKSIMESQGKPAPPQFKRSGTWDSPPQARQSEPEPEPEPGPVTEPVDPAVWARREMKKSSTFKEGTTNSAKVGKLLSKDEINLRAEAFIKQFNLDMRLQREQSDQRRFIEMVNRAK